MQIWLVGLTTRSIKTYLRNYQNDNNNYICTIIFNIYTRLFFLYHNTHINSWKIQQSFQITKSQKLEII